MKKTTKKLTAIMAAMLTVSTVGAVAAMPVFADVDTSGATEASVSSTGAKITDMVKNDDGEIIGLGIDKTLSVNEGSVMPDATFKFTMTPATDEQLKSDGTNVDKLYTYEVKAGPDLTTSEIEIAFSSTDTTTTTTTSGTTISQNKTAYFTLPDANDFEAVGVYRYAVQETDKTDDLVNMEYDTEIRLVDVYVLEKEDGSGDFEIAAIVAHDAEAGESKEPISFENTCEARNLTVKKQVTGSASTTQKFDFSLTIKADDNLTAGAVLNGQIKNQSGGTTPVTITVGTPYAFQLADDEELVITGLFDETEYTVEETAVDNITTKIKSTRYDKDTTSSVTQKTSTASGNTTEGEVYGASATEHFMNHGALTNTGIALTITPIAIAGGLAAAGAILVVTKRKLKK
jgi:pilin isopeptide linkage protein